MGFWASFWMWLSLSVGALVALGFVGKSLFNKLESAAHQFGRLAENANKLAAAIETKPVIERPADSVLADPAIARVRLRALQKAKVKKQEQRQRRLIASLKRFNPDESRFH